MKTQITLLAACLFSAGLVTAQTTNPSSSSGTTTNSTYGTTPTTTDTSGRSGMSNSSGSTMSNGTTNSSGTMNSSGSMNSTGTTTNGGTTSPAYGTSTGTNTNLQGDVNTRGTGERAWGKKGKFGVYGGVNFSRFVNEPIPDGAFRAGYQVGVYGRSAGTVFGQLGLEYRTSTSNLVRRGAGQPTQTVREVRGQIDQQFVAIPAYIGLRIGSALGLRLQAGAELSALIRHPNNAFGLNNDDFRRTILGGLLGAGINLGPLTLDAVYNHGFQNVFEGADTKRRLVAVNVGLRF